MLVIGAGLAKREAQLCSLEEKVNYFMPGAEVPSISMKVAAVDDSQVGQLPIVATLPLKNNCIRTVIELVANTGDGRLLLGRDVLKELPHIIVVVNLHHLQPERSGDSMQKISETSGLSMCCNPLLNLVQGVLDESFFDIAAQGNPEPLSAIRSCCS